VPHGRSEGAAQRLVQQAEQLLPRIDQAISRTARRVIDGAIVPAKEMIVSLFEPNTRIVVRHKAGKTVEFGRKLWLEEVGNGISGGYRLPGDSGQDHAFLAASLAAHKRRFGWVGHLLWELRHHRGRPCPMASQSRRGSDGSYLRPPDIGLQAF
jgi:hypothetical protein